MPELSPLGWIIIGLIGGWLSGMVVPGRQARGCLPNIVVGVIGGIVGGWLFRQLEVGDQSGFLGAVLVSFVGAVVVRVVVAALTERSG
jgi:uncharacterized membrane protein YeaQ/YmgE (transglycosylase-associated protein family)